MSAPRRTLLDALRDNPEWRKLYLARAASLLGDWLNTLAILHLLGTGTGGTAALPLAVVFVLKQMPVFLLGPVAGVVADRFDRRRIMITCDLVLCAVVLCFLLAEPDATHGLVYGLTLLQLSVAAFLDPARNAIVPDLVAPRDLIAANALYAATWSTVFAVGTAVGGVVLYLFGWRVAIAVDAGTYLVSAALLAGIRSPHTRPPQRPRPTTFSAVVGLDDVRDGLRYLRRDASVRGVVLVKATWGMMSAVTLFLTLLGMEPAHRIAGNSDLGITFLWLCRAIGTGIGPIVARRYAEGDSRRLRRAIAAGFVVANLAYVAVASISLPWLVGPLVLIAHIGGSTLWVMSTVLLQQLVPSELRGRTFAAEIGLVMLVGSASNLVYAGLIDSGIASLSTVMVIAPIACLSVAAAWMVRNLRR